MHVIFRERHGLEDAEAPVDLAQSPADLVVLSFSDSDLSAFAAGWHRARESDAAMPGLRLANLASLKHPLSIDTYIDNTLAGAKAILIRLIGGVPYWSYGLQQVQSLARKKGIALAVLPADGRNDTRLDDASSLPISTLRQLQHLCDAGGPVAAQAALAQLSLAAGLYAGPVKGSKLLPQVGAWTPELGVCCPAGFTFDSAKPRIVVTFYRAFLTAADLDPVTAIFHALRERGFDVLGLFAPSLKAPDAAGWLETQITHLAPAAIVNATSFSGKGQSATSPLDVGDVPVFQIALATSTAEAWTEAERGLSPADLAMHVVLPEVDGRLFAGVASFKEPRARDAALEFEQYAHRAHASRIDAIADRVAAWVRLGATPLEEKRVALVLSTYPGKDWQMAHAVGLDALASADAMLQSLAGNGYSCSSAGAIEEPLSEALATATLSWSVSEYRAALETLPMSLRQDLVASWGKPENDPACHAGVFHFAATRRGSILVALQPERGSPQLRDDEYHDLSRTPRHGYVAFYLWMRASLDMHALVHMGAHGTLEWLPGKAVALSDECWPEALIGSLPVIYPFIVNDPGEAAQAKRRIGAVTLGHIPPPLAESRTPHHLARLEGLLDEFSNADGLDPKRRDRLQADIRSEAQAQGVEADLGLDTIDCPSEAITRIDRFVCDIKESQFGDGLHIYGQGTPAGKTPFDVSASIASERDGLVAALAGRRIDAGPSGSPFRGRSDVLPTGRNLFTTDPRIVPTRAAYAQGVKLAEELVRRHLQDEGDYPRGLIVDLWGSATMRTAGEEFAMALHLIGVKPVWDDTSNRVSGIEVLPIALLEHPRIDVTLRVSGLFRDVFPTLSALFSKAIRALAARDEDASWNPYIKSAAGDDAAASEARVYGPAPGSYGLGMGTAIDEYSDDARRAAGEAWLTASSYALDGERAEQDREGIVARVASADAFVHLQDLPETDLLLASDYAAHQAGFAAAQAVTGGQSANYHLDNTDPNAPRARLLREEIARVVNARAANPDWAEGMMRHSFRGAAEIAATLDHLAAFAHLADVVGPHLFERYHDATLGNDKVRAFMANANPAALEAMEQRFAALLAAGLWTTRRNSILAQLEAGE
ncbi:MAG: cobaltochelatase CobN [Hyphomicrobiaceae bacterium]|jgi:cobaltochelatase CobN